MKKILLLTGLMILSLASYAQVPDTMNLWFTFSGASSLWPDKYRFDTNGGKTTVTFRSTDDSYDSKVAGILKSLLNSSSTSWDGKVTYKPIAGNMYEGAFVLTFHHNPSAFYKAVHLTYGAYNSTVTITQDPDNFLFKITNSGQTLWVEEDEQVSIVLEGSKYNRNYILYNVDNDRVVETKQGTGTTLTFKGLYPEGNYGIKDSEGLLMYGNVSVRLINFLFSISNAGGINVEEGQQVRIILSESSDRRSYTLYNLWTNQEIETKTSTGGMLEFRGAYPEGLYGIRDSKGLVMEGTVRIYVNEPITNASQNWIKKTVYLDSRKSSYYQDVEFYDGLGYPDQAIQIAASPDGYNIVKPYYYDEFYRESRQYLPFESNLSVNAYHENPFYYQRRTYQSQYGTSDGPRAFTEEVYEASPLGRVVAKYNIGGVYHDNDIKTTIEYLTNEEEGVLHCYGFTLSMGVLFPVWSDVWKYAPGELFVTKTTDEDCNVSYEFFDKHERLILHRQIGGGTGSAAYHDTYYVYDDYGNLCYVFPPEYCARGMTVKDELHSDMFRFAYIYKYDKYNRLVNYRLPGPTRSAEFKVYDRYDREVLYQDGKMQTDGIWIYTVYDDFDRVAEQHMVRSAKTRLQLEPLFDNPSHDNRYRSVASSGRLKVPFTDGSFQHVKTLVQHRYGGYEYYDESTGTFKLFERPSYLVYANNGHGDEADFREQGLLIYEKIAVVDDGDTPYSGNYQENAYWYDWKGNLVFSCDKDFMGTMEKGFMGYTYDYRNNLTRVFDHAVYPASSLYMSYITRNHYGYDRRGLRMSSATEVLGNDRMFRTTYDYDGILRLKGKEHSIDGKKTSEQMRYNIQGWLTNKTSDAFDMELKYYDTYTAGGIKTYTGNISEWSFRHKGNESQQTTYMYDYDKLGRLVESYSNIGNNAFTEQGLSYDRNGNIQTLKRYGANGTLVDDFKYVTDGNQLYSLNGLLYGYDRNGNCIKDPRQGLDFTYNYLNLVETISKDETTQAKYIWLANGQKVATLNINGDGLIYKGNHVYRVENGRYTLESFSFEEGRVNKETDGSFTYNQHFTDHLGSVRAIAKNGTVQQDQYNYYPFGLSWSEPTTSNRYLYNGKETQRQFANDYLDYGARMYDPTIIRWHNLDPLAKKYYSFSPYCYTLNNPIRFVDPDGRVVGEFLDNNGRFLGNDGIDDGKVYVLKTTTQSFGQGNGMVSGAGLDKADLKATVNFIKNNSGNANAFSQNNIAYANSVEIEGLAANRQQMVNTVSLDTGSGGTSASNNREYGGSIANGQVSVASPGAVANPQTDATVNIMLPSNVSTFHSHPSGNVVIGPGSNTMGGVTTTYGFSQSPSPQDISVAGSNTHYVFGRGDNTVYIYNSSGVQATIPMNRFVNPKK